MDVKRSHDHRSTTGLGGAPTLVFVGRRHCGASRRMESLDRVGQGHAEEAASCGRARCRPQSRARAPSRSRETPTLLVLRERSSRRSPRGPRDRPSDRRAHPPVSRSWPPICCLTSVQRQQSTGGICSCGAQSEPSRCSSWPAVTRWRVNRTRLGVSVRRNWFIAAIVHRYRRDRHRRGRDAAERRRPADDRGVGRLGVHEPLGLARVDRVARGRRAASRSPPTRSATSSTTRRTRPLTSSPSSATSARPISRRATSSSSSSTRRSTSSSRASTPLKDGAEEAADAPAGEFLQQLAGARVRTSRRCRRRSPRR